MFNLDDVEIKFDGMGDYGFHDGFFNAIAVIDGNEFDFQCCSNNNETVDDFNDCGYNEGICGDVNETIASVVGWDGVLHLLETAVKEYEHE